MGRRRHALAVTRSRVRLRVAALAAVALIAIAAVLVAPACVQDGVAMAKKGKKGKSKSKSKSKSKKAQEAAVAPDGDVEALFDDADDGAVPGGDAAALEPIDSGAPQAKARIVTFALEHSVDVASDVFTPRGEFEVKVNPNSGKMQARFTGLHTLGGDAASQFSGLVASDDFYRVRARSNPADENSPYVVTSIRACVLVDLEFEERVLLHVDDNANLVSMEYVTPSNMGRAACNPDRARAALSDTVEFSSNARVVGAHEVAGIPATAIGGMNVPAPATGGDDPAAPTPTADSTGDKKEEKSQGFFSKYMWYIIPVVLLMVFTGGEEPGKGGGRGGGGGSGGGGGK